MGGGQQRLDITLLQFPTHVLSIDTEVAYGLNILVTGCTGFIGSKVARELLNLDHSVQGVDNLADSNLLRLQQWRLKDLFRNPRFTFTSADVSDRERLRPMFSGAGPKGPVEAVINLAARAGVRESVENP